MALSRRRFLSTALTAGVSGLIVNGTAPNGGTASPDLLVLGNLHLIVTISRETGCVIRLGSSDQVWELDGAGMRLHVPAPDHRFHYLTERHVARPRIESDDRRAVIT
jgi:hypothetical protein